jgi:Uncharacterized conserved protein (DUF2267)
MPEAVIDAEVAFVYAATGLEEQNSDWRIDGDQCEAALSSVSLRVRQVHRRVCALPRRTQLLDLAIGCQTARGKSMSSTGLEVFDKTVQTTNAWLNEIIEIIGPDRHRAYRVLAAVLHSLRDRLTVNEAAQLGAQLPILLRGIYYGES